MIRNKTSLAQKIIIMIGVIFLSINFLLFTGATILNKKAFYELEKEKAKLIATNYAPFISIHLFLDLNKKIESLSEQILQNKNVQQVIIYAKDKEILNRSKKYLDETIKVSVPLYNPKDTTKIGKLTLLYSTNKFKDFMNKYFYFLAVSFIFVLLAFFFLYVYIKGLLNPIKNLSNMLQNFDPEVKLDVPYTQRDDEIGLISNAIALSNRKTIEYSKNLQDLTNILLDMNKHLEEKVQKELQVIREKDKQLLHQSRLAQMGEMINMIAHQWRQPLSAISATTSNLNFKLMFDDIDKEELIKEIELISQYSQHLSDTIDDFRSFFKQNKTKQLTHIKNLIEETLDIAKVSIENHNITIKQDIRCNEKINTYPNEVKQVLLNLLKNAQDALLEREIKDPYILIQTECKKDDIYIIVKDNAGGIPKEIMDKIFEPYFSTKLEKDGTGIGLYMSKTIIEEHCKAKLYAKNDDEGARFIIRFKKSDDTTKE